MSRRRRRRSVELSMRGLAEVVALPQPKILPNTARGYYKLAFVRYHKGFPSKVRLYGMRDHNLSNSTLLHGNSQFVSWQYINKGMENTISSLGILPPQ